MCVCVCVFSCVFISMYFHFFFIISYLVSQKREIFNTGTHSHFILPCPSPHSSLSTFPFPSLEIFKPSQPIRFIFLFFLYYTGNNYISYFPSFASRRRF